MTTTKPFQLGTVIQGTLRPEDLLPAFVERLATSTPYSIGNDALVQEARAWIANEDAEEDGTTYALVQDLMSALCDVCPPFVYFGAHPGDGADFGFWPDWDALNEAIQIETNLAWQPLTNAGQYVLVDSEIRVHVDDQANVTVFDLERTVLWTTV